MAIIICPECKKEMSDTLTVCPHCGFTVKTKKKIAKKKIIILVSIILCTILLGGGIIAYKNSPAVKIMKCIENNDLKGAASLYKNMENGSANKLEKINNKLTSHFEKVVDEYAKGSGKYKICEEYMSFVEGKISSDNVESTVKLLSELKSSKDSFANGEKYLNEKAYLLAIDSFAKVKKCDSENFDKAKDNVKECKEFYKKNIIEKIEALNSSEKPEENYAEIQKEVEECEWLMSDKKITDKLDTLLCTVTESVVAYADELYLNKKYIKAAEYLDEYIPDQYVDSDNVVAEYKKVKEKVVDSTIRAVDKKIAKKKYDDALDLINTASNYDVNNELSDKREEIAKLQKNEIIAEFKELKNKVTIKYDSVAERYEVVKRGFSVDYINISNSVNVEARAIITKDGSATAYTVLGFQQSDWIFMESIIIASGSDRKTIDIDYGDRNTQVIYGGIVEWAISSDLSVSEDEIRDLLSASGNVKVRFSGQGSRDHTVTDSEKSNVKTVYKLVDMLNKYSYLKEYI